MITVLATLVLVVGAVLLGCGVLRRHLRSGHAVTLVLTTVLATVAASVVRYRIAVTDAKHDEFTSDTYRYLSYGHDRWSAGEPPWDVLFSGDGTLGVIALSQLTFAALGESWFAVYLAGSFAGLVGSWAFIVGLYRIRPNAPLVYAYLFCLHPSVLYWSSSFGKDSLSLLALGFATAGLAGLWSRTRPGRRPLTAPVLLFWGLAIVLVVRAEIAYLIVIAAVGAHAAVSRASTPGSAPTRVRLRVMRVAALSAAVLLIVSTVGFPRELPLVDNLVGRYGRTSIGDAQLGADRPEGWLGLLVGIPTALLRPFPWEAGVGGLISSLDSLLFVVAFGVLWSHRHAWRCPDVTAARMTLFSGLLVVGLLAALAGYGNLGLLARMRSLMVPAVIMAAAVAPLLAAADVKAVSRLSHEGAR